MEGQEKEQEKDRENEQKKAQERALKTLEQFTADLCQKAGKPKEYGEELWRRIRKSAGVLRELAYFHDYRKFYGKYTVAGYSLPDILVWQVDHFKAYLDREEMNRYRTERLLLESLDVMLKMEQDPTAYVAKMQGETGTDYVEKYH